MSMFRGSSYALQRRLHSFGAPDRGRRGLAWPLRFLAWGGFVSLVVWRNPLVHGRRLRALARLWAWQLVRRLSDRGVTISYPSGVRLFLPVDSDLAGVVLSCGSHEPEEHVFMLRFLRAGDHVIDVGANIGIYTAFFASKGAQVHAFEPSKRAQVVLAQNVDLNGAKDRVQLFACALGARDGAAFLTTDLASSNRLVEAKSSSSEEVEVRQLDNLVSCDDVSGGPVALIKIDVEHAYESVLRGARATLVRDQPVVVVEVWDGGRTARAFLEQLGYRVYAFDSRLNELSEIARTFAGQANFIAIADSELRRVRDRLSEASGNEIGVPVISWLHVSDPASGGG
jgi:FkbM family methyltransferase